MARYSRASHSPRMNTAAKTAAAITSMVMVDMATHLSDMARGRACLPNSRPGQGWASRSRRFRRSAQACPIGAQNRSGRAAISGRRKLSSTRRSRGSMRCSSRLCWTRQPRRPLRQPAATAIWSPILRPERGRGTNARSPAGPTPNGCSRSRARARGSTMPPAIRSPSLPPLTDGAGPPRRLRRPEARPRISRPARPLLPLLPVCTGSEFFLPETGTSGTVGGRGGYGAGGNETRHQFAGHFGGQLARHSCNRLRILFACHPTGEKLETPPIGGNLVRKKGNKKCGNSSLEWRWPQRPWPLRR